MKRTLALILAAALALSMSACKPEEQLPLEGTADSSVMPEENPDFEGTTIALSDEEILVNDEVISTDENSAVYAANDIVFYLEGQDFTYGEGTEEDAHSQEEADKHTVIHITQPGDYQLSGRLSAGQIAIDLGEDAENDPNAVVNLYLNNVDITCTVAPAVIFYNVYECGSTDTETATKDVDTSAAGANVYLVENSLNKVSGSYVARIYKSVELSEDGKTVVDSKKLHKYDAAFYSKQSMNINGSGSLAIHAENEGLDSELHLTINGGDISIDSGNDGINTNEDGISVTTINGGKLDINVNGSTGEGDGIDSNGWLVINGGEVISSACGFSGDAGIDSDMGIHIHGGTVVAAGNMYDRLEESSQNYAVFSFAEKQPGGEYYSLKNEAGETIIDKYYLENDFTYLIISSPELAEGTYTLWQGENQLSHSGNGMGGFGGMMGGPRPENMPEGEQPQKPEGMELPDGRKPENFIVNEDGSITIPKETVEKLWPEGFDGGKQPNFGGQRPNMSFQQENSGEVSTDFTIVNGANFFQAVTAASK